MTSESDARSDDRWEGGPEGRDRDRVAHLCRYAGRAAIAENRRREPMRSMTDRGNSSRGGRAASVVKTETPACWSLLLRAEAAGRRGRQEAQCHDCELMHGWHCTALHRVGQLGEVDHWNRTARRAGDRARPSAGIALGAALSSQCERESAAESATAARRGRRRGWPAPSCGSCRCCSASVRCR